MLRSAPTARWAAPVGTLGIWALALACTVFWGLRLAAPAAGPAVAPPIPAAAQAVDSALVGRALGVPDASAAAPVAAAGRFVLQGVVAGRTGRGTALIAVDGRPARPYRVGALVAPGYVLRSVSPRRAVLGSSGDDDGGGGGGSGSVNGASGNSSTTSSSDAEATRGGQGLTLDMPALR